MIAIRNSCAGPDKEAFHRYLADFQTAANPEALLGALKDCADLLPPQVAESLGLPILSTYRDAVQTLLATWSPTLRKVAHDDEAV